MRTWGGESTKVQGSHKTAAPGTSHNQASTLLLYSNLSNLLVKCSSQFVFSSEPSLGVSGCISPSRFQLVVWERKMLSSTLLGPLHGF